MDTPLTRSDATDRILDLHLLSSASVFNLANPADRTRSCDALVELYFRIVEISKPNLFIEAGAKDAQASRRAARTLPRNTRVVAFEANPYTYRRFERQFVKDLARVEYLNTALSDAVGTVTFNVNVGPDEQPHADGRGSLMSFDGSYDGVEGSMEVTAASTTLDDFFKDDVFEHCALWVDVEGANSLVLRGGSSVIGQTSVALLEVEDREYWSGQWLARETTRYMFDRGMIPVARDFQSRYQYNLLYVRDSLLDVDLVRLALAEHSSKLAHASSTAGGRTGSFGSLEARLKRRTKRLLRSSKITMDRATHSIRAWRP